MVQKTRFGDGLEEKHTVKIEDSYREKLIADGVFPGKPERTEMQSRELNKMARVFSTACVSYPNEKSVLSPGEAKKVIGSLMDLTWMVYPREGIPKIDYEGDEATVLPDENMSDVRDFLKNYGWRLAHLGRDSKSNGVELEKLHNFIQTTSRQGKIETMDLEREKRKTELGRNPETTLDKPKTEAARIMKEKGKIDLRESLVDRALKDFRKNNGLPSEPFP